MNELREPCPSFSCVSMAFESLSVRLETFSADGAARRSRSLCSELNSPVIGAVSRFRDLDGVLDCFKTLSSRCSSRAGQRVTSKVECPCWIGGVTTTEDGLKYRECCKNYHYVVNDVVKHVS